MKYVRLFEQFIMEKKGSSDNGKVALLMDGTGSAGKSYTLKSIGGKKPKDGEDAGDDYEVIALDDFFPHDDNVAMSDPNDPANQKRWELEKAAGVPDEVIEWAKKNGEMASGAGDVKKMYQDSNKRRNAALKKLKALKDPTREDIRKAAGDYIGADGDMTTDDFEKKTPEEALKGLINSQESNIKDNDEFIKECPDYIHPDLKDGVYPGRWYMLQKYKTTPSKKVVFDDVTPEILQLLPKGAVKPVVLHSDPESLARNIKSREKKDPRDPRGVFDDYLTKYEFTKKKPSEKDGDPGKPVTREQMKKTLESLRPSDGLSLSKVDDEYIDGWLSRCGMADDGTYYMKMKDDYLDQFGGQEPVLLNSRDDGSQMEKLKEVAVEQEKKIIGDNEVEKDTKEEIKSIEDTTSKSLFRGMDPKIAKQIGDKEVPVAMPDDKKKVILTSTLMDFVPIDLKDPKEAAMVKAQEEMYTRINKMRIDNKLKPLIPFKEYIKRNIELAKDNKEYQARIKAKALKDMKSKANENMKYILTLEKYYAYKDFNRNWGSPEEMQQDLQWVLWKLLPKDDMIKSIEDQSEDKGIKFEVMLESGDIIHAYKVSQFRMQEDQGWELYFNKKKTSFRALKSQLEREYMSDLDRFLKYYKSYDFYADYIDDGRQWNAATANNDNLVNMFNALSNSDKKKAKKELVAHFKSAELQPRLEQTFKI